jgi:imidazolonepropionase-like amidohydrolase
MTCTGDDLEGGRWVSGVESMSNRKGVTMKRFVYRLSVFALLAGGWGLTADAHDQVPGKPQSGPIAIVGGRVHTMDGDAIERGTVLFEGGKITAVGTEVTLPAGTTTLDASGMQVYPGLIDAYTDLGLREIDALRPSRDYAESGSINPNAKSWTAFHPDSELIPVTRSSGVLSVLSAPSGGLIAGQSAILNLDGWTASEMLVRGPATMQLNWPRIASPSPWEEEEEQEEEKAEKGKRPEDRYREQIKELETLLDDARQYSALRGSDPQSPVDVRLEALVPVVEGSLPLMIAADDQATIEAAVTWCAQQKVRCILYGGYDAAACASLLKAQDVAVIIGGVYRVPQRGHEAYDDAYTLASRLHQAGVRYCISGLGPEQTWNTRNLAAHAATAVAYGLPHAEGLKAITRYPAELLGVDEQVGTLRVDRDATLFVADGDPLEITTKVQKAWVRGRQVDLDNKHEALYRKYQQKYAP